MLLCVLWQHWMFVVLGDKGMNAESSGFSRGSGGYHTRESVDSGPALEF